MKTVAEAVGMMDRVSFLTDRLDELSTRVKQDPELQKLPEISNKHKTTPVR